MPPLCEASLTLIVRMTPCRACRPAVTSQPMLAIRVRTSS